MPAFQDDDDDEDDDELTCLGGWCPNCQLSRPPRGQVAARQVAAWVEISTLSTSLPFLARDSQPLSQGSEHPLFENEPDQDEDEGTREWD